MIQFRFIPLGDILRFPTDPVRSEPRSSPHTEPVPSQLPAPSATEVEALGSSQFQRLVRAQDLITKRRELQLVYDFRDWLRDTRGLEATGLRIPYRVEARELRADLFITACRVLVEAKSTTAREAIRVALGQLLDYRRWIRPLPRLCVLVPNEPASDILELLHSFEIGCAWPEASGFYVVPESILWTESSVLNGSS
jgi:hypothetical protein